MSDFRSTFNHFRTRPNGAIIPAKLALAYARREFEQGARHYDSSPWRKPYAAACQQPDAPRLFHIADLNKAGLRLQREKDLPGIRHTGWFTTPFQDSTCYGALFLLPGKRGKCRIVAGYAMGEGDGYTVNLATVWTCTPDDLPDELASMAGFADSMAERAADREMDYQCAWQAGQLYAEKAAEVSEARKALLELLASRRKPAAMSLATVKAAAKRLLSDICAAREAMREAAEGAHRTFGFYAGSPSNQAAFCEGGELEAFPA